MEEKKTMAVELTAEEMALLERARSEKAAAEAKARKEQELQTYKSMVDAAVRETVPEAECIQETMVRQKRRIVERFGAVIAMKNDLFAGKKALRDGRFTDTFTNSDGTARVTVGYRTIDNYDDTYTVGVEMVEQYISSLATDEDSVRLADMVRMLLRERGAMGQLKAQNVLRLDKIAQDSGNETFIEGMRVIRDAYKPIQSKQFVKVEVKHPETNEWKNIEMNMTNC